MLSNTRRLTKALVIIAATLMIGMNAMAQHHSVQFQDLTFEEAMMKARKTQKIIFVDIEGSKMKCDPCREVENKVFTVDSIADFMNKNCINIKMDMNSDAGKKFAKRLVMLMYPVYAFYDENGNQLEFINSTSILKNPVALTGKARASVGMARLKRENTRSIKFNDEKWDALLAKARKEHKMIFLDAYTSWCRPCMMMASDIFTLDKVADFYNSHFINVSMDMEKGEGPGLVKKYGIGAYPAFLFVDGNGKMVYKGGGYQEAEPFIQLGKKALQAQQKDKN